MIKAGIVLLQSQRYMVEILHFMKRCTLRQTWLLHTRAARAINQRILCRGTVHCHTCVGLARNVGKYGVCCVYPMKHVCGNAHFAIHV